MKTRYATDPIRYKSMGTAELRESFMVNDLFAADELALTYCEVERSIVGSAVPVSKPLSLEAGAELAANYFCERREVGILNVGAAGSVVVDGVIYGMETLDCLYVGRGTKAIEMASADGVTPAKFYILSYPAHASFPTTHLKKTDATPVSIGSKETSNERTIFKYIHPDGVKSCQLVMGVTQLEEGSVWNTFPCHTHERRTEVYLYFNLAEDAVVFHLMGEPQETRHLVMRNGEAVISPMWSIHSGAGSSAYSFCWGMGGENQAFDDMDTVAVEEIL